ncbi:uncharacterized protein si:ch211-214j8.12 [Osmerus eperlanus]|uniref:uncharacterized protein si:ch211-214j8.12 n=1 Tax=Osmerus eperlanus TaxID=29151 RepID=UPI002E0E791B
MPLYRVTPQRPQNRKLKTREGRRRWKEKDGAIVSLGQLCLRSLAENMKTLWVKDYAENYMDQYNFRHIMGPFSELPGELVEELTSLLCSRQELSRAALHLLLVPQLRGLNLGSCPALVTPSLCSLVTARCQSLSSLDVSGAQQLSAQVQCDLLGYLPSLRSLSLAGTQCDSRVVRAVALSCPALRHLDLSRCPLLAPAGLLPLGGALSSSGPAAPLSSLLALDIGLGPEEGDPAAAAAYLLLSLPRLERVVLEGVGEACSLLLHREGRETEAFASREGVCSLGELWRRRVEEEDEEGGCWGREEVGSDEEGMRGQWARGEGLSGVQADRLDGGGEGGEEGGMREKCVILSLKEAQGLSVRSLPAVARLCPALLSISLDCEEGGGRGPDPRLAAGLRRWAGQLKRLVVRFPGALEELRPALCCVGPSLVSLTLEGVRTSPHTPLVELLHTCPRLRTLLIHCEPPLAPLQEEEEEEEEENVLDGSCLLQLCSLSLHFSCDQRQLRPAPSWSALRGALWRLLAGSPLLEDVCLVAVPCPLDSVFHRVLQTTRNLPCRNPPSAAAAAISEGPHLSRPLARLRDLNLAHSDVTGMTAKRLFAACERMRSLDLTGCWHVRARDVQDIQHAATRRPQSLTVKWT